MKTSGWRSTVLILATLVIPACGGNNGRSSTTNPGGDGSAATPSPSSNQPPIVSMTSPASGSSVAEGTPVQLVASASDPDGTVAKVDFLDNGTLIGTSAQSPFAFTWQGAAAGTHTLSAVATDNSGQTGTSPGISLTVTSAGSSSGTGTGGGSVGTGGGVVTGGGGGGGVVATPPQTPAGWFSVAPAGFSTDLQSVFFADANNGWAVGMNGTILHTQNGGTTWSAETSGTTNALMRVQFVSTTRGWIVGALGIMLSTADGGATWTPLATGTTSHLFSLSFVSPTLGWVGGDDVVLKTTDGGASWTTLVGPDGSGPYEAISFTDAAHGWVGGGGVVLSTTDGGATWSTTFMDEMGTAGRFPLFVRDGRFSSQSTGVLVGAAHGGDFLMTTFDGGQNWNRLRFDAVPEGLSGVAFGDAADWWAVGSSGRIFASADGGRTWSRQDSHTFRYLHAVWFVDGQHGWIVGEAGTILRTMNGGRSGS